MQQFTNITNHNNVITIAVLHKTTDRNGDTIVMGYNETNYFVADAGEVSTHPRTTQGLIWATNEYDGLVTFDLMVRYD